MENRLKQFLSEWTSVLNLLAALSKLLAVILTYWP